MKDYQANQIIHNLLLIDESASMQKMRQAVIDNTNDTIKAIQGCHSNNPRQSHLITLFTFNGNGIKMPIFNKAAHDVAELEDVHYKPTSNTPLLDCIGQSIGMLRTLAHKDNCKVVVTILTDGQENGSIKYCKKSIRELITIMKYSGWVFNYVGANHDVKRTCNELNISNYYIFQNNPKGLSHQMFLERMARLKQYELYNLMRQDTDIMAA